MSKKKEQEQLDRIEGKLDEVLKFKRDLEERIDALMGTSGGVLSGPVMSAVTGLLRNGAGKSGG